VATKPEVSEYGFHARRCCLAPDGWPAGLRSARRCPKGTRSTPGWQVPGREGGVVRARTRSAPHVRLPSACGRVGRCARSARSVDLRSDRPTANQPAERVVAARSGTSRMRSTLRSVWEVRVLSPRPDQTRRDGRAGSRHAASSHLPSTRDIRDDGRRRRPGVLPRSMRPCPIVAEPLRSRRGPFLAVLPLRLGRRITGHESWGVQQVVADQARPEARRERLAIGPPGTIWTA
jgi:hypothetical protein